MRYLIGQGFGLIGTVCCLLVPMLKKKWQMLVLTAVINLFFILNLFFIDQVSSAAVINFVIMLQCLVALWHLKTNRPITKAENILFLVIYLAGGALGFKSAIDILPIIGALFNYLANFQPDEQKTRWLFLGNAIAFFSFYCIIGSTSMLGELFAGTSSCAALWKYRKK